MPSRGDDRGPAINPVIDGGRYAAFGEPDEVPDERQVGLLEGLAEAKRRLSVAGLHDGKCPEPEKPCTCGLNDAIDNPDPVPWNKPEIEPGLAATRPTSEDGS